MCVLFLYSACSSLDNFLLITCRSCTYTFLLNQAQLSSFPAADFLQSVSLLSATSFSRNQGNYVCPMLTSEDSTLLTFLEMRPFLFQGRKQKAPIQPVAEANMRSAYQRAQPSVTGYFVFSLFCLSEQCFFPSNQARLGNQ